MTHTQECVLFDLDGTLLDTAPDLVAALNCVLEQHQLPLVAFAAARAFAGQGCKGLLKIGMGMDNNDPRYTAFANELLNHYENLQLDKTAFFPGIEALLLHLEQASIPWGIVTNKPKRFTLPIVEHFGLLHRAQCIISGDTLIQHKPHPAPILHACELLQANPSQSFYVGDTEVDVLASKAAGIKSIIVLHGYNHVEDDTLQWNADAYVQNPKEIIALVKHLSPA